MTENKIIDHLHDALAGLPGEDRLAIIKEAPIDKMSAHDDITRQTLQRRRGQRPIMSLLATAAVLLLAVGGWYNQFRSVDALLYLDINPSVAISLNKQGQVVATTAYNHDGHALLASDTIAQGATLETALADVVDALVRTDHLHHEQDAMLVSLWSKNPAKAFALEVQVKEYLAVDLHTQKAQGKVFYQRFAGTAPPPVPQADYSPGKAQLVSFVAQGIPTMDFAELTALPVQDLLVLADRNRLDLHLLLDYVDEDLAALYPGTEEDDELDDQPHQSLPTPTISQQHPTIITMPDDDDDNDENDDVDDDDLDEDDDDLDDDDHIDHDDDDELDD